MQISGHDIRVEYVNNIFIGSDTEVNGWQEWKSKLETILEKIPSKVDELKPVIQFIVATIAPAKIFMLNREEGSEVEHVEYIDLLVVISGKCVIPFTELEPILEMACLKDTKVSCSLHNEGSVMEGLKNGHLYYCLNFIPDNLVYDDQTVKYPAITPEVFREIKKLAKEKFAVAFQKAEHFYEMGVYLHEQHPSQILAFILHQSVELTYRSILRSLNGYDKKTHEIRTLKKQVRRCAQSLNTIFTDDTDDEKRLLDILESAYLNARYGDPAPISENDLVFLFEKIKQLQILAKKIIESKLGPSK